MSTEPEKKDTEQTILMAGMAGASTEVVQRYGAAVKEQVVAYSGADNEIGIQLKKGLADISKTKVHPDYKTQNLKQQAGFSAEVKETAKVNAEKIIAGETTRKIRTDDLGRVNDPLYDHLELDASGAVIADSGSQMKFVGESPKEALQKLASPKFKKYLENDAKIDVPSDYFDGILEEADKKITSLQKQVEDQLSKGNTDAANHLSKKIESYQTIKKNLQKSSLSTEEAMFARLHPKLSTATEVAKISHRAGLENAQTAALIGGSISIVKNLVALVKGDIVPEEAAKNVAKETATSMAVGYGTGLVGASIKGLLQNATSATARSLATTNLPVIIVTAAIGATKTMSRYLKGEINGLECFEELGEQGTGLIASSIGAFIGQALIPIPFVGGLIGSMLGYALASASYGTLTAALKDARLAHEERLQIERACEAHIQMIRAQRVEIEATIREYLVVHIGVFHAAFDSMKEALVIGDIDGFIRGANAISEALGRESQFQNMSEFNALMASNQTFKL